MPTTRSSIGSATLQPMNDNIQRVTPAATPGKQVKTLKAEIEKKDAENVALRSNIDELTNALNPSKLVHLKLFCSLFYHVVGYF